MHALHAATFHVHDLKKAQSFYCDILGYRTDQQGMVSAERLRTWDAEQLRGATSITLTPDAGSEGGHIRLIESTHAQDASPFQSYGWVGVEFAVQDNIALQRRLQAAGCEILMDPMPPYRPMAAVGPMGEGLLFNEPQEKNPFHYTVVNTKSFVDQIAIVVLACSDRVASEDFYGRLMGAKPGHRAEMPLPFANTSLGLAPDTLYQTGAMRIGRTPFIEIDQYPEAKAHNTPQGTLPSGLAITTLRVSSLDDLSKDFLSSPHKDDDPFYQGNRSATCLGPDGEYIELIEWNM